MANTLRSSQRTPRKIYTDDAFAGIAELQSEEGSESESDEDEDEDEDEDVEEESRGSRSASDRDVNEEDDDSMFIEELGPVQEADGEANYVDESESESESDDDMSIAEEPTGSTRNSGMAKRKSTSAQERADIRGEPGIPRDKITIKKRRELMFGPTDEEQAIVLGARDRWGQEICCPSKRARKDGSTGFAYSTTFEKESENSDANWKWWVADGGKEAFAERQKFKTISRDEAKDYMPTDGTGERTFVMGGLDQQQVRSLQPRQATSIAEAFEAPAIPGQKFAKVRSPDYKSGFVLNMGAIVNALEWAPNQPGGKQYLALSVTTQRDQGDLPPEASTAEDSNLQSPCKSSIQIWEFTANAKNFVDKTAHHRLVLTICTQVGDIMDLKWCPVPSKDLGILGLLALVATTGDVHVVRVDKPTDAAAYTHIEEFAFQSRPAETVCTCLAWLSSTRIAAGCANGFVAMWDIPSSLRTASPNARPEQYLRISPSYIISINSAYPSHPDVVMTSSMCGHTAVTDLSLPDPATANDTASAIPIRLAQPTLSWLEFGKSAISVEDNLTIRGYPLRRWQSPVPLGRIKSQATCIATSPCHPFVLIGSVGGDVTGINPIRSIVDGDKNNVWQQDWFRHEWRRPTKKEREAAAMAESILLDPEAAPPQPEEGSSLPSLFGKSGVSRFLEGFKAQKISLATTDLDKNTSNHRYGKRFATVFEGKTAVTAVAWNPNLHVAGWAAAGMADGLVRVEDIAEAGGGSGWGVGDGTRRF